MATTALERPLPSFRHIPAFRYDSPPKTGSGYSSVKSSDTRDVDDMVPSHFKSDHQSDAGFPLWALDVESLNSLSRFGTREPSEGESSVDDPSTGDVSDGQPSSSDKDFSCSEKVSKWDEPVDSADESVEIGLPPLLRQDLEDAYDEATNAPLPGDGGPFQWSSMKDAARAAWVGGTDLLRYWEILPGGAAKALARLREGVSDRPALALELGMGRGRLAMQIFLSGASVIGVEFGSERYQRAVAASERLAHRRPEAFAISKAYTPSGLRVQLQKLLHGTWTGAIYEARKGDFFHVLNESEIKSATLVVLQVQIPENARQRIRDVLSRTSEGCRVMSRADLNEIWEPGELLPFTSLGKCRVSTSWAPIRGHEMYLWERKKHC
eukprot:gnl/MRDRNA2_/MRDRNA2_100055_c0_seq1.p1 gnl/MRDRNA2_/MRDRNA2_100055_c0~~gnl/MRDRNA2_/MRDRNA2_100055_c0_seq1.p1  ORF type:complete len:381 (-),score=72.03 gnl/MRDRNA2_/MRDRNA2_100055_c0_seq1:43-1185(-)